MQAHSHLYRGEDALHACSSTFAVLACKTSCLLVIVGAGTSHRLDGVQVPVCRKRDEGIILGRLALARHLAPSMPLPAGRGHLWREAASRASFLSLGTNDASGDVRQEPNVLSLFSKASRGLDATSANTASCLNKHTDAISISPALHIYLRFLSLHGDRYSGQLLRTKCIERKLAHLPLPHLLDSRQ